MTVIFDCENQVPEIVNARRNKMIFFCDLTYLLSELKSSPGLSWQTKQTAKIYNTKSRISAIDLKEYFIKSEQRDSELADRVKPTSGVKNTYLYMKICYGFILKFLFFCSLTLLELTRGGKLGVIFGHSTFNPSVPTPAFSMFGSSRCPARLSEDTPTKPSLSQH